ncbi:hypothetical protein ANO11243_084890 [Dothideomycetidae sp. 11243]|nr:hypothetical protein ANO11243_084890 [fungal sp. No.11243]
MPSVPCSQHVADFLEYIDASPTAFHAVHQAESRLEEAGFIRLRERDSWSSNVCPGGKYYVIRNASTIVAFAIGKKWRPGNPLAIIGTHSDSCNLRLKPTSKREANGFLQFGVETYGSGLWHTWFDRDLGVAGRVMCSTDKGVETKLVHIHKAICKIPSLAVHFGNSVPFEFNNETHLLPIAGLVKPGEEKAQEAGAGTAEKLTPDAPFRSLKKLDSRHQPRLLNLVAEQIGVAESAIEDFDLSLFDVQKASIGGLDDELIFSARLDNLAMTYCAVRALIDSVKARADSLDNETAVRMFGAFDHEEVGSNSAQGANGSIVLDIIQRLSEMGVGHEHSSSTAFIRSMAASFFVSADMTHSVNPNYSDKHESEHRSLINKGTVIKINANQNYATSSSGIVLMQDIAQRAKRTAADPRTQGNGVPLQLEVARNDCSGGSTIGPQIAAKTGIRTLDLGNAQLSMHSIRETTGVLDIENAINLFQSYYDHYSEVEHAVFAD